MTDFTLTVDQVAHYSRSHGGGDDVVCHGNHTVEICDATGQPDGWNQIRRDPKTGLCSKTDLMAALGY